VQAITDSRGDELSADELLTASHEHYLAHDQPYAIESYTHSSAGVDRIIAKVLASGEAVQIEGVGNGSDRRPRRYVR
jgi:hypothetical protein